MLHGCDEVACCIQSDTNAFASSEVYGECGCPELEVV
jgi:hypothetical protein